MKRLFYFIYYLLHLDTDKFVKFLKESKSKSGKSFAYLICDTIGSCFRYKISLLEYFQFHFYLLAASERRLYAGTGFMYEYQLKMNPKNARKCLEDKIIFLNKFSKTIKRQFADLKSLKADRGRAEKILSNPSGRFVLKASRGNCGAQVEVCENADFDYERLIEKMQREGYDLLEDFVVQHASLMALSASGLNTVRVITQISRGKVIIVGTRLRISVNSHVDNMAAGNMAASISLKTGIVDGPGVYSDITKPDESVHPVTQVPLVGFKIPFWGDVLDLVTRAALETPENRSVGWDVAITPVGPELIEGNHDWCKLLWQLPVKRGLRPEIEKYLDEIKGVKHS